MLDKERFLFDLDITFRNCKNLCNRILAPLNHNKKTLHHSLEIRLEKLNKSIFSEMRA